MEGVFLQTEHPSRSTESPSSNPIVWGRIIVDQQQQKWWLRKNNDGNVTKNVNNDDLHIPVVTA